MSADAGEAVDSLVMSESLADLNAVLAAVCGKARLDARGARLIKFTSNAVFRLSAAPVVVRVAGSAVVRERAVKVLAVARWLRELGFPAVRPWENVEQPIIVRGQVATLWQAEPDEGRLPTARDLGQILRSLHALAAPEFELPQWRPMRSIRDRLAEPSEVSVDDREFLRRECDAVEDALARVRFALPPGLVHGDATVANLVTGVDGPVICDFDSTCLGPREWDLIPLAVGAFRFDPSGIRHAELVEAYGIDVIQWSGFPVLRRLRELQLVASVTPVLRFNSALVPQWRHRMRTLREADMTALWQPYR
jgi:Ser/Thr protein kinase RdoA (MazF antagonist)